MSTPTTSQLSHWDDDEIPTERDRTIKQTADYLGLTTVRIHGLLSAHKLTEADEPIEVAGRFVKAVSGKSIAVYLASRNVRADEMAARKIERAERAKQATAKPRTPGQKQYIITLTREQADLLGDEGITLRPRNPSNGNGSTPVSEPSARAEGGEADGSRDNG